MKPLMLKISGINSFMEEQVIDFSQLTELGLFGIFGPTGSGKSTILDAITLALYGEIPRSGRDLSGVINSHCDQANVYYEFEIGSKNNKKRYFVSRSYKRDKQGGVRTQGVKLADITSSQEPTVLEERVNAVNNSIAEIIGLRCNDFTRSVVLPQGNFSDFLQLSGRDKRDMLERIFALQEYGSQLSIKINSHKKKVQQDYNFVEGNLMAYEGLSQEAYDLLVEEIKLLEDQYKDAREEFKKIEKDYEWNKELYGFTKEYQGYLVKQEALKNQEENIKANKREYELAERAKNIQPYIEQQNSLDDQLKEKTLDLESNRKELGEVKKALEIIEKKWMVQQDKKENQIPRLLEEKGKMDLALGKKQRLDSLIKALNLSKEDHSKYDSQLKTIADKLKKANDEILNVQERLQEDQARVEELKVSPQYRQKLYQALGVEREVKNSLKEEKEIVGKIKNIDSELQALKEEGQGLDAKVKDLDISLKNLREGFEKNQLKIQDIQDKNMAASLAKDLHPGHSCPVCGSQDHPQKAAFVQDLGIDDLMKTRDKIDQDMGKIKGQLEENNSLLQSTLNQITLKEGLLKQWQESLEAQRETLSKLSLDYDRLRKELDLEDVEEGLKDLEGRESLLEKIQHSIQNFQRKKEEWEENRDKLRENFNNISNEMVRIEESQRINKKEMDELKTEIEKSCGQKDPQEEIKAIANEINAINNLYQQLKKDVERYDKDKHNLDKKQEGLEDTLKYLRASKEKMDKTLAGMLRENGFENPGEVMACFIPLEQREILKNTIKSYDEQVISLRENLQRLEKRMAGKSIGQEQWQEIQRQRQEANKELENKKKELIEKNAAMKDMKNKLEELNKALEEKKRLDHKKGLLAELESLFKGNRFVEFISMGQLKYIAREASQELKKITRGRYALELDAEGNFIMRDDFNGGVRRGTQTLSGGETFLTSLALALALSSHIQLKGKAPLEFFFLDEGFGTLDSELLEVVMDSLEKLHSDRLSVGLISHVEELKQRIPRKLIIDPAQAGMSGTRVTLEKG